MQFGANSHGPWLSVYQSPPLGKEKRFYPILLLIQESPTHPHPKLLMVMVAFRTCDQKIIYMEVELSSTDKSATNSTFRK